MARHRLFSRLLLARPLLRDHALIKHLHFGLFVLEHDALGANTRLQVEHRLLIRGASYGVDELLQGGETVACGRELFV